MLSNQYPHVSEDLSSHWDSSTNEDYDLCDCPGPPPPPKFVIPPPPPSPSSPLCQGSSSSSQRSHVPGAPSRDDGNPHLLQFCSIEPVGAEFTQAAFPSLPIIAVCSSVVLVAIMVASFLLWKHKRKVQNFLPCKSQGRCDLAVGPPGGITYDDVLINHHPTRLPNHHPPPHLTTDTLTPIELLDVKYGIQQQHADPITRSNYTITPSNKEQRVTASNEGATDNHQTRSHRNHHHHHRPGKKKEHFHPIYEEVSATSDDNKAHQNGHSYDSDIEDSEIESRTVGSEDEFAEDELSVAGEYQPSNQGEDPSQEESTTSSLRGSTGGDLYPDIVSGSNERFCAEPESRTLKNVFRGLELGSGLKKHTHSLERNKDGHPSNSFQAKQNYYLNKSMLGPDFTFPEGDGENLQAPDVKLGQELCAFPGSRTMGASLNYIPVVMQQRGSLTTRSASNSPPPPPYTACTNPTRGNHNGGPQTAANREVISALYNPHVVSPTMPIRLPETLLRELSYKLPGTQTVPVVTSGAMSSRSLPVPPSCRAGGTGMIFPMDNPYPSPSTTSISRARSGSITEFATHPYQQQQHVLGGGRPPTPPPENIYASIEDSVPDGGPFTIDGSRHRSGMFGLSGRKSAGDIRNTFGRTRPLTSKNGDNNRRTDQEASSYGDLMSSFNSRTTCS